MTQPIASALRGGGAGVCCACLLCLDGPSARSRIARSTRSSSILRRAPTSSSPSSRRGRCATMRAASACSSTTRATSSRSSTTTPPRCRPTDVARQPDRERARRRPVGRASACSNRFQIALAMPMTLYQTGDDFDDANPLPDGTHVAAPQRLRVRRSAPAPEGAHLRQGARASGRAQPLAGLPARQRHATSAARSTSAASPASRACSPAGRPIAGASARSSASCGARTTSHFFSTTSGSSSPTAARSPFDVVQRARLTAASAELYGRNCASALDHRHQRQPARDRHRRQGDGHPRPDRSTLGVGNGIVAGLGSPQPRVFLGFVYAPDQRDSDHDGVPDDRRPVPRRARGPGRLQGRRRLPRSRQRRRHHPRRRRQVPERGRGLRRVPGRRRLPRSGQRQGRHRRSARRLPERRRGSTRRPSRTTAARCRRPTPTATASPTASTSARTSPRTRTASRTRTAAPIRTTTTTASPTASTSARTRPRTWTASRTRTAAPIPTTTRTASPTSSTSARTSRRPSTATRTRTAAPTRARRPRCKIEQAARS